MSSSSWFERNKKLSIGVGVAAVVGVAAAGIWYLNKKNAAVSSPTSPSAGQGQAHASLAMKHHKAGSHALSISAWTSAIEADPENYKYYNNRAQSHMLLNNYEQALADADQAIQLNSQAAGGYYNRGRAALKLERFEDAASAFTSALQQSDASKIASQAQTLLKTCQDKIVKIRESRLKSVASTKKPSPVNATRVSPTNSGTTSPRVGTNSPTTQKQSQQVAKVASNIVAHAKPVEPTPATSVTAAAATAAAPSSSAPSPSPAPGVSVPVAAASTSTSAPVASPTPSSTQPDLSSAAKITAFLAEQNKIAEETQQKQKAVEVAQKIVDAVTRPAPPAPATTTINPTVSTTTPTNTVTIPSIFSPSNTKSESPVSPVSSDCGSTSNSGIFERSAVILPSDGSAATTPPPQPKHVSRLSFIAPDLISDTTTIDADSAVPIDAFAAINTGTPLQSPPNVFRSISSEVISSTSTPTNANANGSQSNSNSNTTSAATSPILLNKQATIKQQQPQANAPLAFSGENPLDEM